MKVWRIIAALIGGFAVVFVLSVVTDLILEQVGWFPGPAQPEKMTDGLYLVALAYRSAFTWLGFFLTGLWVPDRPQRWTLILGGFGTVAATAGAIANWGLGHNWYPVALAVEALPMAAWAGWVARTVRQPRPV